MGFEIVALDHVQLAMPPGLEAQAEAFYSGVLGLERVPKPAPLAARGGCWFATATSRSTSAWRRGSGRPARPTPPSSSTTWRPAAACAAAGVAVRANPDAEPGRGAYVDDPFGNRIELIAAD